MKVLPGFIKGSVSSRYSSDSIKLCVRFDNEAMQDDRKAAPEWKVHFKCVGIVLIIVVRISYSSVPAGDLVPFLSSTVRFLVPPPRCSV